MNVKDKLGPVHTYPEIFSPTHTKTLKWMDIQSMRYAQQIMHDVNSKTPVLVRLHVNE